MNQSKPEVKHALLVVNSAGKQEKHVTGAKRGKTKSRNQARENTAQSAGKHVNGAKGGKGTLAKITTDFLFVMG